LQALLLGGNKFHGGEEERGKRIKREHHEKKQSYSYVGRKCAFGNGDCGPSAMHVLLPSPPFHPLILVMFFRLLLFQGLSRRISE
jgi:hypothetical protein